MHCTRFLFPYCECSREVLHEVLQELGLMTPQFMNITSSLYDSGVIISSSSHVKLRPLIASSTPIGVRIKWCADDAGAAPWVDSLLPTEREQS
jgi:hypothetical protein